MARPSVAALTIGALTAAVLTGTVAAPAAAANALSPSTAFEIDGNFGGGPDWTNLYGPGTTPSGFPTTGVYYSDMTTDLCADDLDDAGGNGEKLSGGPVWDMIEKKITPSKSDLKSLWLAAEKVDVSGTINDIVYAAYERCGADPGSMIASLFFDNGDGVLPSAGGTGDYLMLFDFNPSQGSAARLYQWSGGGWNTQVSFNAGAVDVYASQTVGEVAINLTALRVLPSDQCRTIAVGGQAATASGYDPSSSLIDLIDIPPVQISNCGDLQVDKTANVPDDGTDFGYDAGRKGGGAVFDGSLDTSGVHDNTTAGGQNQVLEANLQVGQEDTWGNVISGTDYLVSENTGALPEGWRLDTVICTYQDIFTAGYPTTQVTLYENDASAGKTFAVPPSVLGSTSLQPASCTLHNEFTGITVVKAGDGDATVDFAFTLDGDPFTLKLGESATFPAAAGEPVTLTEGALPAAALPWGLDTLMCTDASGASVGQIDLENRTATVTPTTDGLITCTFTNNQRGKLVVQKASDGGTGTFAITGTVTGDITTTADDGTVSGNTLSKVVTAGGPYSVAETPPAGWRLDSIQCDRGEDDPTAIMIGAGETVTCTVHNTKLAGLTLTKEVTGVAADFDWEFGFTLSPAATGGGLQTAAGTGDETSADVLSWTDLQPGTRYTVSESGGTGFDSSFLCTDASGATVPDADPATAAYDVDVLPGMALTCHVTNEAMPADVELTKTVTGVADGFAWEFDFTLSPAATGGGLQTASGGGPGEDVLTWTDLVPGVVYTLAEETDADYAQALSCTGIGEDLDQDATDASVTFLAGLDMHVTCSATNAAQASSLTLTKTVGGVADGLAWEFDFTLAPAATGGGLQTASGTGDGVSQPLVWEDLIPGRLYTLTEEEDARYVQTLSCTGVSDLDPSPTVVTFAAGFDQAIVCAAVNTAKPADLTVTKTVTGVADDYAWQFGFLLSPAATGGGAQLALGTGPAQDVLTWEDLVPGEQYVIAESAVSGYDQQLGCTGVEDLDDAARTVTFIAGFDQSIVCDATNDALPTDLTVTKTVSGVADDYDWQFGFLLTPQGGAPLAQLALGTGNASDTIDWQGLVPGTTYVLAEVVDSHYTQTLLCTGVEDLDQSATTVTFVAGFDQSVTCEALNVAKPSRASLTKTTTGVDPTFAWSFDFTVTPAPASGGAITIDGVGATTSTPRAITGLVPGQVYEISEVPVAGFLQTLVCDGVADLDLSPSTVRFVAGFDLDITCGATNEAIPSSIELTKTVTGVAADYAWDFGFTLTPAATGGGEQRATGTGPGSDTLVWQDLIPGTQYVLAEEELPGYEQSLTCEGVNDMDDDPLTVTFRHGVNLTIVCTATNEAIPSSLEVTKTVTGVAADYAWSFDFTLAPAATGGGLQTASGTGPDSDTLTWSDLVPGTTYVVSEEVDGDYDQALQCTGVEDLDQVATSVTFVAGFDQSVTCEATNDALPSELTVTKTVTGVAEDYTWSFDFTLTPAATGGGLQTASGTGPDSDTLTWEDLVPGTEYVIEEQVDADYSQTLACTGVEDLDDSATSVTFVAGFDQSITCAAGNAAEPSSLMLTKEVRGVADGYAWSFDFTLLPEVADGGLQTASGTGDSTSAPLTWADLVPGTTYSLIEELDPDYAPTLACTGVDDLDPSDTVVTFVAGFGQAIVCTAVNTALPSSLELTKTVTGVAADYAWSFDFTLSPEATGGGTQTAAGVGAEAVQLAWSGLVPGETYVVEEAAVEGYTSTVTCTGVEDMDDAAGSVTFVAGFGHAIECAALNEASGGVLDLTKTVAGVADGVDWEFMFTITPAAGDADVQSIAGTGSGTSDAISWTGLIPGVTYLVAEAEASAYDQEMVCTGVEDLDDVPQTVTFVAELGGAVTCEATNTLIPEKEVIEEELSETGAEVRGLIALAILLMGTGLALVASRRRRLG